MLVILKHRQVERFDRAIRRIAGDDVHLAPIQRTIEQSQIHEPGRPIELQSVCRCRPGKPSGRCSNSYPTPSFHCGLKRAAWLSVVR